MKKTLLSLAFLAAGAASYAQITSGSMMIGGTLGFGSGSGTSETTNPAPGFNTTTDLGTTSSFNIAPTFGYFLMDNVALGVMVSFGSTSNTTKGRINTATGATSTNATSTAPLGPNEAAQDFKQTTSTLGVALFANKYMEISEKWMWFAGANLHYRMMSAQNTEVMQTTVGVWSASEVDQPATTTIGLGANLGVLYFLNNNWALQANLNNLVSFDYNMTSQDHNDGITGGNIAASSTKVDRSSMDLTLGLGNFGLGAVNVGLFYFLR